MMSGWMLVHTYEARKTYHIFIVRECGSDIIRISVVANNKGSLHPLCFSVRVSMSLNFHLYRDHCLQFISRQTQMSQPS